jgi:hypothetical protein
MQKIKFTKWYYLTLAIIIFCKLYVIVAGLIFDPTGFDFFGYLRKSDDLVYVAILIPIVLISLKVLKSYLALAIMSVIALLVRTFTLLYLIGYLNLHTELGEQTIYENGTPTFLGWVWVIVNPLLLTALLSTYLYVKDYSEGNTKHV